MQHYVYINGERRGPLPDEEIRRLLTLGVLHDRDLCSVSADGEWKPLSSLQPSAAPPPADSAPATPISSPPPSVPADAPHDLRVSHESLGAYARATVGPNETVFYKTSVHWVIFLRYVGLGLLVFLLIAIPFGIGVQAFTGSQLGWFALPLPMLLLLPPTVAYVSSELVVTNRRVLVKTGAVERQTLEMFVSKIESVAVHQTFLGRMLDYGTVIIRGTGGSDEPFRTIAHPIEFRNCIQRLQGGELPGGAAR